MKFLDRLEKKYQRYAIPNLMRNIIIIQAVFYLLHIMFPDAYNFEALYLVPHKILNGEIWRIISFLFLPPLGQSVFFAALIMYMHFMIGTALEKTWGEFKFNLYYLIGMISIVGVSLLTGNIATNFYLNTSCFLAFATLYPDYEFLLFFIIPVKVKYLAFLSWVFYGLTIVQGAWVEKLIIIAMILNYILFFYEDIFKTILYRRKNILNRKKREKEREQTYHTCTVCGVTEKDNPEMGFRYCSKCDGHHEYCLDHIKDHEHIIDEEKKGD